MSKKRTMEEGPALSLKIEITMIHIDAIQQPKCFYNINYQKNIRNDLYD